MSGATKTAPKLRFPEFSGQWKKERVDWFLKKVGRPVVVKPTTLYREIGVRSHGKGLFHKVAGNGEALGDKRVFWVEPNALVLNIVFAWEQAVALTGSDEVGFIASHRFPMFVGRESRATSNFARDFFLTRRGKYLLELASPGGAGRNKTLGQSNFAELVVVWPDLEEQEKIAEFLASVEARMDLLQRRRNALAAYKLATMQRLFSQALRFADAGGAPFPDWQEKLLGDVATFRKGRAVSKADLAANGKKPCIRYGELYTVFSERIDGAVSATNLPDADLVFSKPGDVLLPASGESPLDMASAACVMVGGVAIGADINIIRSQMQGLFLAYVLRHAKRVDIAKLAQGNSVVHLYGSSLAKLKISIPDMGEQKKIGDFLAAIDAKIAAVDAQSIAMKQFKKVLLQRMFV